MMGIVPALPVALRRPATIGAVALGAFALAGCGVGPLDTAATVNGRVISERALQDTVIELNEADVPVTPVQVLDLLVKGPAVEALVTDGGGAIAEAEVVAAIRQATAGSERPIENPSPLLVEFVTYDIYLGQLGGAVPPEALAGLDVEVNPRYGQWDPQTGALTDEVPEWITPVDDPAATAPGS